MLTVSRITDMLISTRHSKDLCVSECKDGPSMGRQSRRLDLWTMARSYTNFITHGYEIKISRSDFLKDEKWQDYLPLCHQLYFVTPWAMVQPSEVPGNVGLIWCSKNLTRCYVKKKAAHRDIEMPIGLITYILMSRVSITENETYSPDIDKVAHIRDWLAKKASLADLGYGVAKKAAGELRTMQRKYNDMEHKLQSLQHIERFWLEKLGGKSGDLEARYSHWLENTNKSKAEALKKILTPELAQTMQEAKRTVKVLQHAEDAITMVYEQLKQIENNG